MAKPERTRWLDRRVAAPGSFLALCLDEAAFRVTCKHLRLKTAPPDFIANAWSDASTHYFDGGHGCTVIVCIRDWQGRNPIEVAGLLIHEAVHVWQEYARRIGEREPGVEQEAYAVQAIAQELMAEFAWQAHGRDSR
jgi:hypothetical protein